MSGNALRAEELTQEIFVRAWEKIRLFKGKSSFFTWLYRLAVNYLLQSERSRRRSDARVTPREPSMFSGSSGLDFEVETRMDIEQALSRLPKKARAVLILHEIEGMTHIQIAQLAGISPGTSKAQLHRARKLLKEELSR